MNGLKRQDVSTPDNWLHNEPLDYTRTFSKFVYLGIDAEPWPECTDKEKKDWEKEHPQPEPEPEQ